MIHKACPSFVIAGFFITASLTAQADDVSVTNADWNFEGAAANYAGSGTDITLSPDSGTGTLTIVTQNGATTAAASGVGFNATTALSVTAQWAVGDYVQIEASTLGLDFVGFNWGQASVNAAKSWELEYSTDGVNFTEVPGYTYTADNSSFIYSEYGPDLSSLGLLNQPEVYFRLVAESTSKHVSAELFDDFMVFGNEPDDTGLTDTGSVPDAASTLELLGGATALMMQLQRRWKK